MVHRFFRVLTLWFLLEQHFEVHGRGTSEAHTSKHSHVFQRVGPCFKTVRKIRSAHIRVFTFIARAGFNTCTHGKRNEPLQSLPVFGSTPQWKRTICTSVSLPTSTRVCPALAVSQTDRPTDPQTSRRDRQDTGYKRQYRHTREMLREHGCELCAHYACVRSVGVCAHCLCVRELCVVPCLCTFSVRAVQSARWVVRAQCLECVVSCHN